MNSSLGVDTLHVNVGISGINISMLPTESRKRYGIFLSEHWRHTESMFLKRILYTLKILHNSVALLMNKEKLPRSVQYKESVFT